MDRENYKTKIELDHQVFYAGKLRIIPSVILVQLPDSTHWSVSAKEIRKISREVCHQILLCNDSLSFKEAHFLKNFYKISPTEITSSLLVSASDISLWGQKEGSLGDDLSVLLRKMAHQADKISTIIQ